MFFIQSNAGVYLQYDEQVRVLGKMNQDMKNNFDKFFEVRGECDGKCWYPID